MHVNVEKFLEVTERRPVIAINIGLPDGMIRQAGKESLRRTSTFCSTGEYMTYMGVLEVLVLYDAGVKLEL
jgi:hypothetical protein